MIEGKQCLGSIMHLSRGITLAKLCYAVNMIREYAANERVILYVHGNYLSDVALLIKEYSYLGRLLLNVLDVDNIEIHNEQPTERPFIKNAYVVAGDYYSVIECD